jgi:serine/threonine protein kinase
METIGKGGMGAVYRARHQETGQIVALKVMAAEHAVNAVLLRRFEQEFAAANRLTHAHIVRGLGFGVDQGRPYLVMEYIDGHDLLRHVKEHGPLPVDQAVALIGQIADALHTAHHQRLIHRDVKPENILLTRDGQAKLADLGLIRDIDNGNELTKTRTGLGTITYMAPEQFENAKWADARSDVYGLAATLYYLLTGMPPFQGRGNLTVLGKKLRNDFDPPRRRLPDLPIQVDQAICQALDGNPKHRPVSCQAFADLLGVSQPASTSTGRVLADQKGARAPNNAPPVQADEGKAAPGEQRAAPRYPCVLPAACRPFPESGQPWSGHVLDISRTGIHLQLARRFEPGVLLRVELADDSPEFSASWLARVRWVRQTAADCWSIGCALCRPLCEDELMTYVEQMPATAIICSKEDDKVTG